MKIKKTFAAISISLSLLASNSCAAWFQGKVDMDMDINNITIKDLFYVRETIKKLDTPSQLFVSQGLHSGKIELTWTKVDYATSYRIERAVVTSQNAQGNYNIPDESDFNVINEHCYDNSFTDIILTNPQDKNEEYGYHYFYRVSAENYDLSIESEPTVCTDPSTRGEGWLFSVPLKVEAEKGKSTGQIKLTWQGVSGASFYKIYRTEKENGTGLELIDKVYGNQNFYVNSVLSSEQGTEFYYKVVATNNFGHDSAYSAIAMGYSLKEGAPSAPSEVKVLNGLGVNKSRFNISWDAVSTSGEVTYSLYRSSSVDAAFTLVKSKLTSTTYIDESNKLEPGIIYYYFVQTVSTNTTTQEVTKSPFSEKTEASQGFLLSAPVEFEIADSPLAGNVLLVWSPAVGSDLVDYTYNIYYSDTQDGVYTALVSNVTGTLNEDGKYEFEYDKKNFYRISTWNEASAEDKESNMSIIAAPVPDAPENVVASKTERLEKEFVPNKNNVYPVRITWDKPSNDNPAGYLVYRSTKPDSGFRKVMDEPVTSLEYIDNYDSAKSGIFYYYKVISVNSLGQGKKGNNPEEDLAFADGKSLKSVKCLGYGALTADQWFREYNKTVMNSQKKLTYMHKPVDTDKLGKETVYGNFGGTLGYDAHLKGLGAEIIMPYKDYVDYRVSTNSELIAEPAKAEAILTLTDYFLLNGNNDTTSNMSGNGSMSGTVKCQGMYPGTVNYGTLEIKAGAAGGGCYGLDTFDLDGNMLNVITNMDRDKKISDKHEVHWLVGEEGR